MQYGSLIMQEHSEKKYGICPADIYLPGRNADKTKWAVVACDQYTSEPEYWERVEKTVGDAASSLKLIRPEAFLDRDYKQNDIPETMKKYLEDGTLYRAVENGFIITERTTASGKRIGLIAAVDLEQYDFRTEKSLIRATEGTVESRLPAREKIRSEASLEIPHVMILINDPEKSVIEPLYEEFAKDKGKDSLLYDFELMENGGHLRGFSLNDEKKQKLYAALSKLHKKSDGFMYAIGDGNHSIAAAKNCWDRIKAGLTKEEAQNHPARFALSEIVNLHSDALKFRPIHRVVFDTEPEKLLCSFKEHLKENGIRISEGSDIYFVSEHHTESFSVKTDGNILPVALLSDFLDQKKGIKVDYIHGDDKASELGRKAGNAAFLLQPIEKDTFFDSIAQYGHLPKKTFSMGEAPEKRYYMECRRIR